MHLNLQNDQRDYYMLSNFLLSPQDLTWKAWTFLQYNVNKILIVWTQLMFTKDYYWLTFDYPCAYHVWTNSQINRYCVHMVFRFWPQMTYMVVLVITIRFQVWTCWPEPKFLAWAKIWGFVLLMVNYTPNRYLLLLQYYWPKMDLDIHTQKIKISRTLTATISFLQNFFLGMSCPAIV